LVSAASSLLQPDLCGELTPPRRPA